MTRFVLILFSLLTMGATYMTVYDVGVMEPSIQNSREGSSHRGIRGVGYGHYGK